MVDLNKYYASKSQDARSTRGIMSRGANVYRGGSNSAKPMDLSKAARRKMGSAASMTPKQKQKALRRAAKRRNKK